MQSVCFREQSAQAGDIMPFLCPHCGQTHKTQAELEAEAHPPVAEEDDEIEEI